MPRIAAFALALAVTWIAGAGRAEAQLDRLISPGALARPHAALEGLANCQKCHEQGRKVTAAKCLTCHAPVAQRMAKRVGVHANVSECVTCHVDHAGADGQLRPFDTRQFDHARVTGFALDGKHARAAANCAACHKTRSFLTASASCASCHVDPHRPSLGRDCATCHSARDDFKNAMAHFDHARAAFPLNGAHRTVACSSCHVNNTFKGVKFASCANCHKDPHEQRFGATCASCHTTTETWRTKKFDHNRTAFRLIGRHATVDCAGCHKQPATKVKPRSDTCSACHVDPHRGTFKQDCKACHNESGFSKAAQFDHSTTRFALTGKHAPLACSACHKGVAAGNVPAARRVADFRGLQGACASCHNDVHAGELGTTCERCHSSSGFRMAAFVHPRFADFFAGQHAPVACDQCHMRDKPAGRVAASTVAVRFKNVSTACATCHRDAHAGQEGTACEACHSIKAARFAADGFSHAKTAFALTGRHESLVCADCHKRETGAFPAGTATSVRYKGTPAQCRACHEDVHQGQLTTSCESCHTTTAFKLASYVHKNSALLISGFFGGRHAVLSCQACHKPTAAQVKAARAGALQFKVDSRCVSCHVDVHRGALGTRCLDCHRI